MKTNYQFTQVPTNLFILLDNNCRSMLFTLIQLSSYYADEDGWFFRTCHDLEDESNLSQNLVKATLQTLFNEGIIEAKPVGQSRGKKSNYYKINFDSFEKYNNYSIEECMKDPRLKIRTVEYKGSNFKLNLVREVVNKTVKETVNKTVKSDHNINNIDNVYNIDNINNIDNIFNNIIIEENNMKKENNFINKILGEDKTVEGLTREEQTKFNENYKLFKSEIDKNTRTVEEVINLIPTMDGNHGTTQKVKEALIKEFNKLQLEYEASFPSSGNDAYIFN